MKPLPHRKLETAALTRVRRARGGSAAPVAQEGQQLTERGVTVDMRGGDGRIRPAGPRDRAQRVRSAAVARWAAAGTDLERLAVADDYAAAAAAAASRGGVDPSEELDRAIRVLWAAGEQLTRRLAESEDRDV